jgi:hypothetical protein
MHEKMGHLSSGDMEGRKEGMEHVVMTIGSRLDQNLR